jgi:hypothetical protein
LREETLQPAITSIVNHQAGRAGPAIGPGGCSCSGAESADDIIDGYKQLIARAHVHGMRIIVATLTPSKVRESSLLNASYFRAGRASTPFRERIWP